jgi:endonuclease I
MLKCVTRSFLTLFISQTSWSQIPAGYYNDAIGLSGEPLKIALHSIIDNHTVISYNALWSAFAETDVKPNGKVWDMYSDIPGGTPPYEYTFGSDECGSYASENDCYNREHSWPKSWFNEESTPYSDLFHLIPTDGYVNGIRNNYPYGEVGTAYYTSQNGSMRGSCISPGYFGIVFEPIDGYKGDLARGYFYMTTRYFSEDAGWASSPATTKSQINQWQLDVLLQWHHDDPVSTKEITRNNIIYSDYQENRNPFIDHPEWADSIWGTQSSLLLKEQQTRQSFRLYPNPAQDFIEIDLQEIESTLPMNYTLTDYQGATIIDNAPLTENKIAISALAQGMYVLQLTTSSHTQNLRFVKK